jgi:hypothetical protein
MMVLTLNWTSQYVCKHYNVLKSRFAYNCSLQVKLKLQIICCLFLYI